MRNVRNLVRFNSQFGASLNNQVLAIMPKPWFGESVRAFEEPIKEAGDIQILT